MKGTQMIAKKSLKVLGLTLVAALAMAIAASGAGAAQWYTATAEGGPYTTLPVGSSEAATCANTSEITLDKKLAATTVIFHFEHVTCVNMKIVNTGVPPAAEVLLKFKFTGLKVTGLAAGCTAVEPIETKEVKAILGMDAGLTSGTFAKFEPVSGTTVATVELNENCGAAAGAYPIKGTFTGESTNATEVGATTQMLTGNEYTSEPARSSLTFGVEPVRVTGTIDSSLNSGKFFTAK
jgi:hypothetical protein